MPPITIQINVCIPALNALIAYLVDRDNQQPQIDALNAQVTALLTQLGQSQSSLQDSIDKQKGQT